MYSQQSKSRDSDGANLNSNEEELTGEMFSLTLEAKDMQQQLNGYLENSSVRPVIVKRNKVSGNLVYPEKFYVDSEIGFESLMRKVGKSLVIASDGSCESERGYSVAIFGDNKCIKELTGRLGDNSTAQLCEMVDVKKGFELAVELKREDKQVILVSDSAYMCNVFSEQLEAIRKSNNMKSSGKVLVHRKLIMETDELLNKLYKSSIIQVKFHVGIKVNEKEDELAKKSARYLEWIQASDFVQKSDKTEYRKKALRIRLAPGK
ncbi:Ribonuclease H domain and Ribonuclease H-like domain-containing protein [Strongyloides ratti]|uniref:Ribonuclease H domain and Ribonuclease H-like domain-containing protein n=1 Tax=Strongyloides ratti TaxID=34506 RepID=A0A090KQ65_STRRB|nr:Ribonuclease H domain and Ribonuclease H-like domain-containing protein [Strongyloides ratti]CEF59663.1 Ribonuclease H domain and Ribonuclease H-like domain-containing protein [Strongyloides ratti]